MSWTSSSAVARSSSTWSPSGFDRPRRHPDSRRERRPAAKHAVGHGDSSGSGRLISRNFRGPAMPFDARRACRRAGSSKTDLQPDWLLYRRPGRTGCGTGNDAAGRPVREARLSNDRHPVHISLPLTVTPQKSGCIGIKREGACGDKQNGRRCGVTGPKKGSNGVSLGKQHNDLRHVGLSAKYPNSPPGQSFQAGHNVLDESGSLNALACEAGRLGWHVFHSGASKMRSVVAVLRNRLSARLAQNARADRRRIGAGDPLNVGLEVGLGVVHAVHASDSALDVEMQVASHPNNPLPDYLKKLEELVIAGYRDGGFPNVRTTARFDAKSAAKCSSAFTKGRGFGVRRLVGRCHSAEREGRSGAPLAVLLREFQARRLSYARLMRGC